MEIKISRECMCMSDALIDHSFCLQVNDETTYEYLYDILKEKQFFPPTPGDNAVWVLTSKVYDCIFSYFAKTDRFSAGLAENKLRNLCYAPVEFVLRYYANPQEWKTKIENMYQGNMQAIQRDGWMNELDYCDLLSSM